MDHAPQHRAEEFRKRALAEIPNMKLLFSGRSTTNFLQPLKERSKLHCNGELQGNSLKSFKTTSHPPRGIGDEESQEQNMTWLEATCHGLDARESLYHSAWKHLFEVDEHDLRERADKMEQAGTLVIEKPETDPEDGSDTDIEDNVYIDLLGGEEDEDAEGDIDHDLAPVQARSLRWWLCRPAAREERSGRISRDPMAQIVKRRQDSAFKKKPHVLLKTVVAFRKEGCCSAFTSVVSAQEPLWRQHTLSLLSEFPVSILFDN